MKRNKNPELKSIKEFSNKNFNWFPGHMKKAMDEVKKHLKSVDILLEIRDARSPLVTSNKSFTDQMSGKSRLIVMNKNNLANPAMTQNWKQWFEKQSHPFIFINGLDKKSLDKVFKLAKETVLEKKRQSNPDYKLTSKLRMMIIGLPNTGKSTIINSFSNRNASGVADKPGRTQHQLWVKATKYLDILDTPGIMPPNIHNEEQALWLSALHAIPDRLTSNEDTACYILNHILKYDSNHLEEHYKVDRFTDDLLENLNMIANSRGCIRHKGEYDYDRVFKMIIHDFRSGKLGLISFGSPPISK